MPDAAHPSRHVSDVELDRLVDALPARDRERLAERLADRLVLDDVRAVAPAVAQQETLYAETTRTTVRETIVETIRTPVVAAPPAHLVTGWYDDPSGRYWQRWWNSEGWSQYVATIDGHQLVDAQTPGHRLEDVRERRQPTRREIVRGVHCCDASVQRWWRRYRREIVTRGAGVAVLVAIVLTVGLPEVLAFILWGTAALVGLACVVVMLARPRGGPGVCG